jgi:polysaccharide biosynthesis protein PslH
LNNRLATVVYCSPYLSRFSNGGTVVAKSNLDLITTLFGDRVKAYSINREPLDGINAIASTQSKIGTAWANFQGLCATLSAKGRDQFLFEMKQLQPDVIWFDTSLLGGLIPQLRFLVPHVKIICLFQNVEPDIFIQRILRGSWQYIPSYFASQFNERQSSKLADGLVTLTQLDSDLVKSRYDCIRPTVLPVSIKSLRSAPLRQYPDSKHVIFVASDYWPNIEGLRYLNDRIAPLLKNVSILVVGKGLERHISNRPHHRLEFLGYVDDLQDVFYRAKVSLAPIFSGGGMKVKIAESLMHNRSVIATPFAAIGYEETSRSSIRICESPENFADAIENWCPEVVNSAFNDFQKYYSVESNSNRLLEMLANVGIRPKQANGEN